MSKASVRIGAALAAALVIGWLAGRMSPTPTGVPPATARSIDSTVHADVWTCSMHPQIRQPEPGACPICGMDLVAAPSDHGGGGEAERRVSISRSARALADIQTTPVRRGFADVRVRLVGTLHRDETREKSLTARFPARIDELFVNYTGIAVEAGEHLARVYSPELLTAQRELLTAHASDPAGSIARAAREKMRLWDLLPAQIDAIVESGTAQDHFVLRAPIGGIVVDKQVNEGDYVKTGQPLFGIVDLSELWLNLDAYESDLMWLRYGQDVTFTVEALPGETFHGRIAFIEPEVDRRTRTVGVRVNVDNADGRLKPGMLARGVVRSRIAARGRVLAPELAGRWVSPMHPEVIKDHPGVCDVCGMKLVPATELGYEVEAQPPPPLLVPTTAVLRTGKRAVAYVEVPGAARPTYEGREVVLGPRAGEEFVVVSGLSEGERVVTHGAFKIDSALQIQARPSMMNPQGGGPSPGHDHGAHASSAPVHDGDVVTAGSAPPADASITAAQLPELVAPYLGLQAALADDDLEAAHAQVPALMAVIGHEGALGDGLHEMLAAGTLEALRVPHFARLSEAMIAATRAHPTALQEKLLLMHCPMARDNRGADWLQAAEPLRNPYYGAMMLGCGEVRQRLGGQEGHGHR
jgi:Cu(I)/Ag(I) efflux system membrane fusion protein